MLPEGYKVVTQTAKGLVIGMDFSHRGKEALSEITLDGKTFTAGPMTAVASEQSSVYCCCREYFFKHADKVPVNIRHITNQVDLELLAEELGVRSDWHEPDEQGLTLDFNGKSFGNDGVWGHKVAIAPDSLEQYITIRKNDQPIAELNMATLLSWASNHDMKPNVEPIAKKPFIELAGPLTSEEFREFLYELLCASDTNEYIEVKPLSPIVAAVSAFSNLEPVHRSWALAQYFEDEGVIKVSNATGIHEFTCMGFDEALKLAHKFLFEQAENMRDLPVLYDLLTKHVNIDADSLFKEVLRNNMHSSVNFYDVLKDMEQDPDDILADAVDDSVCNVSDSTLIDVAATHFELGSDELMESALDNNNVEGSDLVDIAEEMEVELPEAVKTALNNGQ